jgi:hypothetical protein
MIVIGSRAAKFFSHSLREPKDWDIIGSQEEIHTFLKKHKDKIKYAFPSSPYKMQVLFDDGTKMEFESDDIPSNKLIKEELNSDHHMDGFITFYGETLKICPPIFLMLMKRALLNWPVHWDKTIKDYHDLREQLNSLEYQETRGRVERKFPGFLTEREKKFFNLRLEENEVKFGKKKISLNMKEEKFFERSKKIRTMDHDLLHRKIMYYEEPLYEELKIYSDMPMLSEDKFNNNFTFDDRIKAAQEECLSIAFERYYIPKLLKKEEIDLKECYKSGIRLVVSKLTKGWFCDFIIDHYDYVLNISEDHLSRCKDNVTEYFKNRGDL